MAVLFWVLIVRPQRKRMAEHSQLLAALGVGDEIMSTAGIYGTVVAIHDDDTIELEVAEGVVLTVAKGAIASRTDDEPPEVDTLDD